VEDPFVTFLLLSLRGSRGISDCLNVNHNGLVRCVGFIFNNCAADSVCKNNPARRIFDSVDRCLKVLLGNPFIFDNGDHLIDNLLNLRVGNLRILPVGSVPPWWPAELRVLLNLGEDTSNDCLNLLGGDLCIFSVAPVLPRWTGRAA